MSICVMLTHPFFCWFSEFFSWFQPEWSENVKISMENFTFIPLADTMTAAVLLLKSDDRCLAGLLIAEVSSLPLLATEIIVFIMEWFMRLITPWFGSRWQNSFMQLKELFTHFLVSAFIVSQQDNQMKKTCQNRQIDVLIIIGMLSEILWRCHCLDFL